MKIALVHDWLNTKNGGGEQVLFELAQIYPNAPIYTLIYNEAKFGHIVPKDRVHTSGLQKLPSFLKKGRATYCR